MTLKTLGGPFGKPFPRRILTKSIRGLAGFSSSHPARCGLLFVASSFVLSWEERAPPPPVPGIAVMSGSDNWRSGAQPQHASGRGGGGSDGDWRGGGASSAPREAQGARIPNNVRGVFPKLTEKYCHEERAEVGSLYAGSAAWKGWSKLAVGSASQIETEVERWRGGNRKRLQSNRS